MIKYDDNSEALYNAASSVNACSEALEYVNTVKTSVLDVLEGAETPYLGWIITIAPLWEQLDTTCQDYIVSRIANHSDMFCLHVWTTVSGLSETQEATLLNVFYENCPTAVKEIKDGVIPSIRSFPEGGK